MSSRPRHESSIAARVARRLRTPARVRIGTEVRTVDEDIREIQSLLREVVDHLKRHRQSDRRKAVHKAMQIASLASTMALTPDVGRCR